MAYDNDFLDIGDRVFTVDDNAREDSVMKRLNATRNTRAFAVMLAEVRIEKLGDLDGKTVNDVLEQINSMTRKRRPATRTKFDQALAELAGAVRLG